MSKISLSPSPTGSAVYTIASPAGSTDRTFNLPDSAGTVATAESTLAQFNVTGSAPVFACRAFVNFNGQTSPGTIRASGNVSSVTRLTTGEYAVNFSTAMPDTNYCVPNGIDGTGVVSGAFVEIQQNNSTTSSVRVRTMRLNGANDNFPAIYISVFR